MDNISDSSESSAKRSERASLELGDGTTDSERYLTALARRSFLSLWSYPNLYRDDGGKEICDLLVVFENDIMAIFAHPPKM